MSGKSKCDYLKKYREKIASEYGIKGFKYEKCKNKGECIGTCPFCDKEVSKLNENVLSKIKYENIGNCSLGPYTYGGFLGGLPYEENEGIDILDTWYQMDKLHKDIELPKTLDEVNCSTPVNLTSFPLYINEETNNGRIFGIERLRINIDGDGITTLIGLYGCPLSCKYCINSDIKKSYSVSVDELFDIVLQDELYYTHSGGGICFGGHEPLLQADFILSFIRKMREEKKNWKIGIETSLAVNITDNQYGMSEQLENRKKLLKIVDYLIVDIKSMNRIIYESYTNHLRGLYYMRKNLEYILKNCSDYTIKVPKIPDFTYELLISETVKDLLDMGFLYEDIKVVDYIIPPNCKKEEIYNDLMGYLEGDIEPFEDSNDITPTTEDSSILDNNDIENYYNEIDMIVLQEEYEKQKENQEKEDDNI